MCVLYGILPHQLYDVGRVITHILHIREIGLRDVNQHAPGQLRRPDSNLGAELQSPWS